MTLDELMREIRQKITCVAWDVNSDWPAHLAPTGDPYVALCSGGVKGKGDQFPCLCASKDIAINVYRITLFDYVSSRPGILYWRVEPEIIGPHTFSDEATGHQMFEATGHQMFYVYSRLAISDRPIIKSAQKRT